MPVKDGDTVKVHYRGTLDDGTEFDSSAGREPLEFTMGKQMLIPGFEKAVLGMEVGESTKVRIPPAEAYGEKDDRLIFSVPMSDVPDDFTPEVGVDVHIELSDGMTTQATITEVDEEQVTLDANQPLAGETLTFEIEVVAIN